MMTKDSGKPAKEARKESGKGSADKKVRRGRRTKPTGRIATSSANMNERQMYIET